MIKTMQPAELANALEVVSLSDFTENNILVKEKLYEK